MVNDSKDNKDMVHENETQAAPDEHARDLILSHQDAQAGGPDDISIGGEEDPGVGLESLVENLTEDLTEDRMESPVGAQANEQKNSTDSTAQPPLANQQKKQ